jgi:hypothetical protein
MGGKSQCMIAEPAKLELPPFLVDARWRARRISGKPATSPPIPSFRRATAETEIVARKAGVIAGLDLAEAS